MKHFFSGKFVFNEEATPSVSPPNYAFWNLGKAEAFPQVNVIKI